MNEPLGVVKAVVAVMGEIGPIAKDRVNRQQNFNYRSIDQIYDALNQLLAKHGLVIFSSGVEPLKEESWTTRTDAKAFRVAAKFTFTIVSTEDSSQLVMVVMAEAADYGDKAYAKAASMAYKQMALQLFCIPVTDIPDGDADESDYARKGDPKAVMPPATTQPIKPPGEVEVSAGYRAAVDAIARCENPDDMEKLRARVAASKAITESERPKLIALIESKISATWGSV